MIETPIQLIQDSAPRLAWVLIHSLWQAAAVSLILWALLRCIPVIYARARYTTSLLALTAVVALSVGTHAWLSYAPVTTTTHTQTSTSTATATPATEYNTTKANRPATPSPQATPQKPLEIPIKVHALRLTHTWSIALCTAWILGMLAMILRTAGGLRHASQLRIESKEPPLWLAELLAELARQLKCTRRVMVRICDDLATPAALGLLQPLIVLPPTVVQGDPINLRIILLHELAHIRSHDYLVNLVQSLIEAMLFFNPAVWWIGQHIRMEREATCDAVAARAMDNKPEEVARALGQTALAMHGQTWPTAGALTWAQPSHETKNQGVAERIRRLIDPRKHVAGPVPWHLLAVLLIVIAGVVAVFHQTTSVVIAAVLDGKEHIEQVERIAKEYGSPLDDITANSPTVTISGRVVMPDGTPPKTRIHVTISSQNKGSNYTTGVSVSHDGGFFRDADLPAGKITVSARAEGFGVTVLKPFYCKPGETIDGLVVKLQSGYEANLLLTDPNRKPVPNATIKTTLWIGNTGKGGPEPPPTDEYGRTTLRGLTEYPIELRITAKGYQYFTQRYTPKPDETITVVLLPSRPMHGLVVDAATDRPVPDAEVRLISGMGAGGRDPRSSYNPYDPEAITDSSGKFELDDLPDGEELSYWFAAEGYRPQIVWDIQAGQTKRTIRLLPKIELTVKIIGPLDRLDTDKQGQPIVSYHQSLRMKPHSTYSGGGKIVITPTDTGGVATLDRYILDNELTITAGPRIVKVPNPTTVQGPIVIDLRPEADPAVQQRQVILQLHAPEGWPEPTGTLKMNHASNGARRKLVILPIENSRITFDIATSANTPGTINYGPIKAAGYWVAKQHSIEVLPGDEALVIDVPLIPAGTIYGRVLDERGEPATDVRLNITTINPPDLPDNQRINPNDYNNVETGPDGRFIIDALPLGGRYRITARNHLVGIETYVFTKPITLDANTPTQDVDLVMPDGTDVTVTVIDPEGQPIHGAKVRLDYTDGNHGHSSANIRTYALGKAVIRRVNFDLPVTYKLTVEPTKGYTGEVVTLKRNNTTPTIQLKPGLELQGILLDDTTGQPLPNRTVTLRAAYKSDAIYKDQIQVSTNAQGRFVFRGLEPVTYQLNADRTASAGSTVTTLSDGRYRIQSPSNRDWIKESSVQLPQLATEPFELRVVPY